MDNAVLPTDASADRTAASRAIERFVPRFARNQTAPDRAIGVHMDARLHGAVLVADIAGFSAMTENKARLGQAGIEEMQSLLNRCFERIVSTLERGGGEVYKFAGDATMAWWPAGNEAQALAEAAQAAASTALRLQALVPELAAALQTPLSLRIGIGAGPLFTAIVGGHQGRWEALLAGEALEQVASLPVAASGQVVLSDPAFALLRGECSGAPLAGGGFAMEAVTPAPPPEGHPPDALPDLAQLEPFVPRHLVRRLLADPGDQLAELRNASVLFAIAPVPTDLATLQAHTLALQRATYDNGGSVLQYLVDDKACLVFIAAWGIPGSSHPDDAERAMRTAHTLVSAREAAGTRLSCGVASGRLFAGLRGSQTRAEFALIGAVVNLAARLAQTSQGQVYCDEATARAVPAIAFTPRPEVVLKGIRGAPVFESLGQRRIEDAGSRTLVGRQAELRHMLARLPQQQDEPGPSTLIVVEGEAGIGKSHLCAAFMHAVGARGLVLASSASDPLDNSAAYRPLRAVFDTLLGMQDTTAPEARLARIMALLPDDDATRERVSLLSEPLGLGLPPSTTEQQMSGRGRIEATTDLLVRLLAVTAGTDVRVVLVEDLHWLDSASWGVLEQAVRRCPGLLIVLSTRPLDADAACAILLQDPSHLRLQLEPLQAAAVRDIIASELGATDVPEPLWRAVADRTQGLPLFVHQVVAALVQGRIVWCTDGAVHYDPQGLSNFAIPDTIQGVVIARIDQLTPHQQMTLKSASVVGREFTFEALASAATPQGGDAALQQDLQALVAAGLVEGGAGAAPFRFSHALVRDAVYSLLPLAVRRTSHAALGAWYERRTGVGDNLLLARMAWHWDQAHDPVRALRALEAAGDHALRAGTYREAQNLFSRLVTITTRGFGEESTNAVTVPLEQAARWHANLGLASYDLGELERARAALETAARLLDQRVPERHLIGLAVAREAAGTALRRWWPVRGTDDSRAARARQTAHVYSTLGRIYHLTQRPRHTVYSILRRLNLLAPHPACAEQMGAFAGMMYLCTMLGRHDWADHYATELSGLHRRLQDPLAFADANLTVALAYMGQARWEPCEQRGTQAEQIFHRLGERQGRMLMLAILANTAELQGHFDRAAELWTLLEQLAGEVGDQVGLCWSAGGMAMLEIRRGDHAQGAAQARRAIALARSTGEAVSYLADTGLLALCLLESGDTPAARALVDEGIVQIGQLPRLATAHHLLNGLDAFTELILRLWELDAPAHGSDAWRRWSQHAALATNRASGYARVFAIGRPMAARHRAMHLWLRGRPAQAITQWQQAIAAGQQNGIPYETAKSHLELARHLAADDPRRHEHAHAAAGIFTRIGAHAGTARALALTGI